MKAAVIGVGSMGMNHARAYHDGASAELIGVVDPNPMNQTQASKRFQVAAYPNVRELVQAARPDVVSIATPTQFHAAAAIECMEAGIDVLVEKPLASSVDEAKELVAAAERNQRTLQVGHIERFNPALQMMRQKVANGVIGKPLRLHARRLSPFPGRILDVGVMLDLAPHELDAIRFVTGQELEAATTVMEQRLHPSQEDAVMALLNYSGGLAAYLEVNWLSPTRIRELTITGEQGMLKADYLRQQLTLYKNGTGPRETDNMYQYMMGMSEGDQTQFAINRREPLAAQLDAFVAAAREGSTPLATGEDGVRVMENLQVLRDATVWKHSNETPL